MKFINNDLLLWFQYLSKAGYCAQGNSFIEDLTGREMLIFIAALRGISSDEKEPVVDFWLSVLGLYFMITGSYSLF